MKHLRPINITVIPYKSMRYPTCGDYENVDGIEMVDIAKLKDSRYEFLIMIHELIEWFLTEQRGISEKAITRFDKKFEKNRKEGDFSEPGDSQDAPYHKEHMFAAKIEGLVADELGVDWNEYDKAINEL